MKNIQAIDGANNATFSIFQATEEEFALLFPDGTDVAFREDIEALLTEQQIYEVFNAIWSRPCFCSTTTASRADERDLQYAISTTRCGVRGRIMPVAAPAPRRPRS